MKKKLLVAIAILLFLAGTAFVVLQKKDEPVQKELPDLLLRKSSLSYEREWTAVSYNAALLSSKIKKDPSDTKSMLALASIYLQEARITGNYAYYNDAGMALVTRILANDPLNYEAIVLKTTILLSRHQFADALILAEDLAKQYPHSAHIYGVLVDVYVELGRYEEAVIAADKMISIRPDTRSYSRIAYLREIHGDIPGAIEAMQMAIDAGAPGDENTEWCRIQMGKLYEHWGSSTEARHHYNMALLNRPNFPPAITGLARLAAQQQDYDAALSLYLQADSLSNEHTTKEGIAEMYAATGQKNKAEEVRKEILEQVKQMAKEGNEDMELAHAYLSLGEKTKALTFALKEYEARSGNIDVNETVAMVYASLGEFKKALPFLQQALKTGSKKPELHELATHIYAGAGIADKTNEVRQ